MSTSVPQHYSQELSFEQQLLYVLSRMKIGSAAEIAIELMELQGVSSEDGVADLTLHTEKQLEKLCAEEQLDVVREKHEKKRYKIRKQIS